MSYKALYRTYRPKTFLEVAGQKHIVKTLQNAFSFNKIAHAYLFSGPRGIGKTSMAKLFAKSLNCEEGLGQQCNKCSNCTSINDGSHPDVIEIDAASNNGVEEVRDLVEKVKYLPIKGKYKVYIIDEVHMMTSGAFNALLKTLEEPPSHVIFILATTEPHKVIPTIVSRCQRYDFTKVEDDALREKMIEILKLESINYELNAVNAIIELADGGVRDALSILEHVLAYAGNELKEKDVYTLFGLASTKEKLDLLTAVATNNVKEVLERFEGLVASGIDLKRLTTSLLDILKDLLIYLTTEEHFLLTLINEKQAIDLGKVINLEELDEMIEALLKANADYKIVANIRSLFELVLLRLTTSMKKNDKQVREEKEVEKPKIVKKALPEKQIKKEIVVEKKEVIAPKKEEKNNGEIPGWLLDEEISSPKNEKKSKTKTVSLNGEKFVLDDHTLIHLMVLGNKEERLNLHDKWDYLNSFLGDPIKGEIASLLKDGRPYIVTNQVLVLEYDFEVLANRLNIKKNQNLINSLVKEMINREVFVYAVVRNDALRLQKEFLNLRQLNQLPKGDELELNLKEVGNE